MSQFSKQLRNPIELIKQWWPEANIAHISYDESMKNSDRDYFRIESCGHDGTLNFTIEMFQKLLVPLVNMQSYHNRNTPEDWSKIERIEYTIGRIKHATVFGTVALRCGNYPGQRESVKIPVKCRYIYK